MLGILGESNMVDGLPKILMAGTTPNGVFGAKIHFGHFRRLGMNIVGKKGFSPDGLLKAQTPALLPKPVALELLRSRLSDLAPQLAAYELMRSLVPDLRIIWLRRRNMLARAISHYRARKSGLWHQPASNSGLPGQEQPLEFDLGQIHNLHCVGQFEEEMWQRFFQERNISPYCLVYEEFIANYESTVRGVLEFLDVAGEKTFIPPPRSLKQSDGISQEWENRYHKLSAEAGL